MKCKNIEKLILTDYIDGKLSGDKLRDLEDHIASCSRCRKLTAELRAISAGLERMKREEPSFPVWNKIKAEIEMGPAESITEKLFAPAKFFFTCHRTALVAVTAAMLIFTIFAIARLAPTGSLAARQDILTLVDIDENGSDEIGTESSACT